MSNELCPFSLVFLDDEQLASTGEDGSRSSRNFRCIGPDSHPWCKIFLVA
jgi:hypothetical protein